MLAKNAASASFGAVLDRHEVLLERDGLALRHPARLGLVALDVSPVAQVFVNGVATGLAAHKSIDEGRVVGLAEVLPSGW